jgi:hypothetical protein
MTALTVGGSNERRCDTMKKFVIGALTAALVSIAAPASAGEWTRGPCNGWFSKPGVAHYEAKVRALIGCAERKWPVSAGLSTVLAIAERESGLHPGAENPTSGACGVFQSMPSLWPERAASLPQVWFPHYLRPLSCFHARANVLWAVRAMHYGGLGPWSM